MLVVVIVVIVAMRGLRSDRLTDRTGATEGKRKRGAEWGESTDTVGMYSPGKAFVV